MNKEKRTRIRVNKNHVGTFKAYILHLQDRPPHFFPILEEEDSLEVAFDKANRRMIEENPDYSDFKLEQTFFKIHPEIHAE